MTLRQLEYLLAVADTGSFTKAAERLYVAQPSLSQQIQALEAELGGRLLDRPPKPIRLTAAGRAFAAEARVALAAAGRAADGARRAMEVEPPSLSIVTVRSLAVAMLPACIRQWRADHPDVVVTLHEYAHRREAEEALRNGDGDIGIGPSPSHWSGALEPLGWDELVVVLPLTDPLANGPSSIALEELADRDWVLFEDGHGLAEHALAACRAAGFEPKAAVQTAQVEAATRLAATGLGPTLVPAKNVPDDITARILRLDPPAVWELAAYVVEDRFSPLVRQFVDVIARAPWQRSRPANARVVPPTDAAPARRQR